MCADGGSECDDRALAAGTFVGSKCLYIFSCTANAISSDLSTDSLKLRGAAEEGRLENGKEISEDDDDEEEEEMVGTGTDAEGRAAVEMRAGGTITGIAIEAPFLGDRFDSSATECKRPQISHTMFAAAFSKVQC